MRLDNLLVYNIHYQYERAAPDTNPHDGATNERRTPLLRHGAFKLGTVL